MEIQHIQIICIAIRNQIIPNFLSINIDGTSELQGFILIVDLPITIFSHTVIKGPIHKFQITLLVLQAFH